MKIPNYQPIHFEQWVIIDQRIQKEGLGIEYVPEKHQLEISKNHQLLAKLYLPWDHDWIKNELQKIEDFHLALLAIRAGQAFAGYFHQDQLEDHKVFRAYMVRQKQGKSQIKHLKTKGKSRAGSRIRLAETARFFNEINERLQDYSEKFPISRWGISCSKTLWPYFFNAEVSPPFSPKQENVLSLPFHYHQASFEELQSSYSALLNFHLFLSAEGKDFFQEISTTNSEPEDDENW
ncbi:MAG: hypothetical protein HWE15_07900 [Algoriphagus sp.]|uniref:hypothetical protein n=1 Tax=Algoriphagus sp. TaxID=1872435 RepID=UPI00181B4652|nr:hypothetical protein [Algoriphagus sp.]NVJ86214.1 hypothetical protein [Algoriphagus sp.]